MKNVLKKVLTGAAAVSMAFTLTGCSDASAEIPDRKEVLFSVGGTDITKGEIYSTMETMAGADTAINNATNLIAAEEIEVTDDIKEQAQSTLDTYKSMYGDSFTSYLESAGMSEDDYLNDYLIPSLLASQLTDKYIEEKWDSLVSTYKPRKAIILEFSSYDDLTAAKAEIDGGATDYGTVASNHNSSSDGSEQIYTTESTSLDSMVRSVMNMLTPEDGWTEADSSDGSTYDLVKVTDDDPDNFHDDLVDTFKNMDTITTDATQYFFKKYNFHIYDITLYNAVKAAYPDDLVQDLDEEEEADSTSSPVSTASAN